MHRGHNLLPAPISSSFYFPTAGSLYSCTASYLFIVFCCLDLFSLMAELLTLPLMPLLVIIDKSCRLLHVSFCPLGCLPLSSPLSLRNRGPLKGPSSRVWAPPVPMGPGGPAAVTPDGGRRENSYLKTPEAVRQPEVLTVFR